MTYFEKKKIYGLALGCLLSSSMSFAQSVEDVVFGMNIKGLDFVFPFDASNDPNQQLGEILTRWRIEPLRIWKS